MMKTSAESDRQVNHDDFSGLCLNNSPLENIGPAARTIRKINSNNIAQPGRTIPDLYF